jgi:competence protein ComEC
VVEPRHLQLGEVTLRPLWPDPYNGACADPAYGANNSSIVLQIVRDQAAILLAGDIEQPVEELLVDRHGAELGAAVLKVPHHGSATSSGERFLEAVQPRLAVVACGAGNGFGVPHEAVQQRYARIRAKLLRTDRLGAIAVRLDEQGQLTWGRATGLAP